MLQISYWSSCRRLADFQKKPRTWKTTGIKMNTMLTTKLTKLQQQTMQNYPIQACFQLSKAYTECIHIERVDQQKGLKTKIWPKNGASLSILANQYSTHTNYNWQLQKINKITTHPSPFASINRLTTINILVIKKSNVNHKWLLQISKIGFPILFIHLYNLMDTQE